MQIGIIGGTGLDDPDILEERQEMIVDTPYGKVLADHYTTVPVCKFNNA